MLAMLLACAPSTLQVDTGDPPAETARPADSATPAGDSGDTTPRYDTWTGTRDVTIGACTETVNEVGTRLDDDWVQYDLLVAFCDRCEHWFVLDVGPTEACGRPVDGYTFRGLHLGGVLPEIYWMDEGAVEGGLYAEASWDGADLIYGVQLGDSWQDGRVVLGTADHKPRATR